MTKEALKLALEALETLMIERGSIYEQAIAAVQRALANEALEKMAENARELGLDYEPEQTEQHQDWCASLTQMLMSMPPKPAPCNCKPKPEQPKVRTGNCLRVGVCASEGHKIAPQRTWVGLTDEEILLISADCAATHQHMDIQFARAIEAALKAKNT